MKTGIMKVKNKNPKNKLLLLLKSIQLQLLLNIELLEIGTELTYLS